MTAEPIKALLHFPADTEMCSVIIELYAHSICKALIPSLSGDDSLVATWFILKYQWQTKYPQLRRDVLE